MRDEKLLKELTQLMGVSGFEKNVRERIEQEAKVFLKQTRLWMSQKQQNRQKMNT